ncbi:serine--tRNA ligase [Candidatus Woesearchaeota archaeon]|nr:serine--tRNA ligase [Candidatus Woesearchaeota archaeon]
MLDIKLIREKPKLVQKSCKDRGYDIDIKQILKLDEDFRKLKASADSLRSERNKTAQEINQLKKEGKDIKKKVKEAKKIPEKISKTEEEMNAVLSQIKDMILRIPNIMHESVPAGDESKNKEIKKWGKKKKTGFKVKPHWQIGEELGIIDMERAAKLAGSGFYVLKGDGARLQRALVQFMLDFHNKHGFTEINPPQIVNAKTMTGTGNLPKFEEDLYRTREGLYLIPTAEVPVTNLHADEILNTSELPKLYTAFTQCYRTEAGRHGAETRGIFRLHEFEKVEMVMIVHPEKSWEALEDMRSRAEKLLELLEIPYRVLVLATQDAGFASAKTYDIECYAPADDRYLEVSSCSNCTDFQARRMNTRMRTQQGNVFVHTLNGSGLALPRLMISILENYQNEDSSITIPKLLQPYMGGQKKITKK